MTTRARPIVTYYRRKAVKPVVPPVTAEKWWHRLWQPSMIAAFFVGLVTYQNNKLENQQKEQRLFGEKLKADIMKDLRHQISDLEAHVRAQLLSYDHKTGASFQHFSDRTNAAFSNYGIEIGSIASRVYRIEKLVDKYHFSPSCVLETAKDDSK